MVKNKRQLNCLLLNISVSWSWEEEKILSGLEIDFLLLFLIPSHDLKSFYTGRLSSFWFGSTANGLKPKCQKLSLLRRSTEAATCLALVSLTSFPDWTDRNIQSNSSRGLFVEVVALASVYFWNVETHPVLCVCVISCLITALYARPKMTFIIHVSRQ